MTLLAFLNPAFLWGALAFTVPLIIHLINRRRYRVVTWAAMDFLLSAYKKKNRRMRLENLLLLLLRCAIPAILAFALARPYFGDDHPLSLIAENRREVVVVVDESYSMGRQVGGSTLLQSARTQIQRLLDTLSFDRGDTCTVMTLSREPRILVQRSTSPGDLERALNRLEEPVYVAADLRRTIDVLASEVLPEIPSDTEVYVLSDFQRQTFAEPLQEEAGVSDGDQRSLRQRLQAMTAEGVLLTLVNLSDGTPLVENASVVDLRCSESLAISQQAVRLIATVERRSQTGSSGTGRFVIGNREHPVTFTYDKDGQAAVEIYHSFADASDQAVEFRLDEDDLVQDNDRFLRVPVRDSIPLLIVDGAPSGADPLAGEVGNMLLVLDPLFGEIESQGLRRYFEPQWMPHHEFNRGRVRLSDYQAVLLANVREIDESVAVDLENYVRRGGGLWVLLGDQVRPESYNQRLYRPGGAGLMPMPLAAQPLGELPTLAAEGRDWTTGWYRMRIEDELHPMVRTFVDDRRRHFLNSPVFRFLPFEMDAGLPDQTRVVLSYQDPQDPQLRLPALVHHPLERGHVAWYTSSADEKWSLFAQTMPGYFPLVWDVTRFLSTQDPSRHQLGIGDAIRKSVPAAPLPYTITIPDGQVRQITELPREETLGQFPLAPFAETQKPGIYTLDLAMDADAAAVRELFAVNVDPQEGDLDTLVREELTELLDRVPFRYDTEISQLSGDEGRPRQGEIWRSLVMVLLVCLLLETALAWRFGAYQ